VSTPGLISDAYDWETEKLNMHKGATL